MKKTLLGASLIILGAGLAVFVGLYLCLFGGIVQIVNGIKDSWDAVQIAIGCIRLLCTGVAASASITFLCVPGWYILTKGGQDERIRKT